MTAVCHYHSGNSFIEVTALCDYEEIKKAKLYNRIISVVDANNVFFRVPASTLSWEGKNA